MQGTGGDLFGEDAGADFVHLSLVLDGVGDVGRLGWRGPVDGRMAVLDRVDGRGWLGVVVFEALGNACQGLCGAEEGVFVGTVADSLAFDSILLSDEFQGCGAQVGKTVVIQGCVRGIVHCAANIKMHMAEFKGLRACVGGAGVAMFRGSKQPVEGHDNEVNDMSVESSIDGVLGVNDVTERAEDGHIDRAGAGRWVVVFAQL